MGPGQMRASVSHTIQRLPFEDWESGFPRSGSVGTSIWLNSYKTPNLLPLLHLLTLLLGGWRRRFLDNQDLLQPCEINAGHQFRILEDAMAFLIHLPDLSDHQPFRKISAQTGGDHSVSCNHIFRTEKVFQLTPVLAPSLHNRFGPGPLDDGVDGAVVIVDEEDDRMGRSGFKDLADHPFRKDHRHPFPNPILFPFIDGDALEP